MIYRGKVKIWSELKNHHVHHMPVRMVIPHARHIIPDVIKYAKIISLDLMPHGRKAQLVNGNFPFTNVFHL